MDHTEKAKVICILEQNEHYYLICVNICIKKSPRTMPAMRLCNSLTFCNSITFVCLLKVNTQIVTVCTSMYKHDLLKRNRNVYLVCLDFVLAILWMCNEQSLINLCGRGHGIFELQWYSYIYSNCINYHKKHTRLTLHMCVWSALYIFHNCLV